MSIVGRVACDQPLNTYTKGSCYFGFRFSWIVIRLTWITHIYECVCAPAICEPVLIQPIHFKMISF